IAPLPQPVTTRIAERVHASCIALEPQDFHARLGFSDEHEQRTDLRVLAEQLARSQGQAIERGPHVLRHRADEDMYRRRQHQPTCSARSTRSSAVASKPAGTRIRTPSRRTTSRGSAGSWASVDAMTAAGATTSMKLAFVGGEGFSCTRFVRLP